MPNINKSAIVPYQPAEMFQLVNEIEKYPEFLPWCKDAKVHLRDQDEVEATLVLHWSGMQKSFTTRNRLQANKMIEVRLVEGPFHHLQGFWRFDSLGEEGCKIILDLEFEFSNRLISMAFGPVFHQVATTLVDAFCQRAKSLYGAEHA